MATLLELEERGDIFRLDPDLDPGQQEYRLFYTSPTLKKWIEDKLPILGSDRNIEELPNQQFDSLVEVYASGDTLTFGWTFKPLTNIGAGVWEFKTADLRIFGWFHKKDCFVGAFADETWRIKRHSLYRGYAGQTARFCDALALDQPKYIDGDDPNDVVSNYAYP